MTTLLFSALVLGIFVAAIFRIRTTLRTRPASVPAQVFRALDDRILWTGAVAAIVVGAVYVPAKSAAPWLNWSWTDSVLKPVAASANEGSLVGTAFVVVLLLGMILAPLFLVGPVTRSLMLSTVSGATYRNARKRHGIPMKQPIVLPVVLLVAGAPVAMAVPAGIVVTLCGMVVRREVARGIVPADNAYHGDVDWSPHGRASGQKEARVLARMWADLSPVERWVAVRTAAVYGVLIFLTFLGMSLVWLFSINVTID